MYGRTNYDKIEFHYFSTGITAFFKFLTYSNKRIRDLSILG